MKLVVLITAQPEKGMSIAQAWQDYGAPGITILQAHGFHSLRREVERGEIELPRALVSMASALANLMQEAEARSQIIFSLVSDEALVDRLIAATTSVLGDLTEPDNGILFVLDVERALGVRQYGTR